MGIVTGPIIEFSMAFISDIWDEARKLMDAHHAEVGILTSKEFNPDRHVYETMERAGATRTFTLRLDAKLIGYATFLVQTHPDYPATTWAYERAMYVVPRHRGMRAIEFQMAQDDVLKGEGLIVVRYSTEKNDRSKTLTRMEYKPLERSYTRDYRKE